MLTCALSLCNVTSQRHAEDRIITEQESDMVAKMIEEKADLLATEMEMEYSLESARREGQNPASTLISHWRFNEEGTHYKLAQYLREMGLTHVSNM